MSQSIFFAFMPHNPDWWIIDIVDMYSESAVLETYRQYLCELYNYSHINHCLTHIFLNRDNLNSLQWENKPWEKKHT